LAATAQRFGSAAYVPQAIELARQALPTSEDAAAARGLLDAVQSHTKPTGED
jgi:hypothetical protein